MKAFLASLALIAVISTAAAFVLGTIDMSAQNVYQQHSSVRL
ncbi:MAG: hypothetical protein R3D68_03305 [Hyphomicrobiaceae bacterium]